MQQRIWLEATEPITVNGRDVLPGERFEMSRTESGALLVMGQARIAKPQKPPAAEPEPPKRRRGRPRKTETTQETAEAPTRQYRRRDLEAEP